ncbi:MAG: hypothetical protein ACO294_09920 [Methylococcales bacterium]
MIMEPFEVYRYYLALRLHFTTDQYDVIKQQGRVRASKNSFLQRKDLLSIRKVAETYSDKDVVDFLVANFVSGDRWGGIFDSESKDRYLSWKRRIESMSYTFKKDISYLNTQMMKQGKEFKDCLVGGKNEHPFILKSYYRSSISIETLVILNKIYEYINLFDTAYSDDLMWPELSRIIKKYSPFLHIEKEKYDAIFRTTIGLD